LVSSLPYVVGYKGDGDLNYIPMGNPRTVDWIAIDPALKKIALENLECRLVEHSFVSVLTKSEDGNWVYESVAKENLVRTEPLKISADGLKYPVPTDVPGRYELDLRDKETGARLSQVNFRVVGRGSASKAPDQNAELELKLSRDQFNTGDEIEVSIVAPYTGSGLITIERDKVYAHTWFKTDKTSSVQRIRVPEGFEGTGYVSVCFVRGLDAKEVFMSPLSYAVAPFKANIEKRRLPVTLRVTEKAVPGEPFRIGYKTDRPARIVVYAVDQGILQVSDYKLPDPLAYFFRKEALMVSTSQIVDLILPEFSILRKAAAFGGDGEEKRLNPFRRVTEKPVVYWSGVIDSDAREREVIYNVPDYFSGTLTVMAVAVAPDGVGSAEKNALVRGPFVITPNVPTVAAPGDVFDVSATVANGVAGSGDNAEVRLGIEPSEHLEIVKGPEQPLHISEGSEISATFTVRAREKFGSATLLFHASTRGQETKLRSTLSVRPAVAFMTSVLSGNFTRESVDVKIDRTIHPDYRKLRTVVSAVPLGLAHGLDAYLKNYPNGCSEQLVSGAFCRLILADETDFGLSRAEVSKQLEQTFGVLRRRQNDQGSFGYWAPDNNAGLDFVSAYAMHFLIEAKAAGFAPPLNLFQGGLRHLQAMAVLDPRDLREARTQAYAIYLLTREGVITTNYLLNLRDFLDKRYPKKWQSDLTAVYLAGTYSMLKKNEEAQAMLKGYKLGTHDPAEWWDFYSSLGADSQFIAVLARHFPDNLKRITAGEFEAIVRPVGKGEFSTLSAAYAVLALKNYSQQVARNAPELGITEISSQKKETTLRLEGAALIKRAGFSAEAVALRFSARNQAKGGMGAFYQVVEAGYDQVLPVKPLADGLEIFREFLDEHGEVTQTAHLGEPITVRLRIRTLKRGDVSNVAILDLLPGGFEMAAGSLQPGVGSAGCDYVDVREDRTVFFATIGAAVREIRYKIKPTNRGVYVVPPVFAEAMYDRTIKARGLPGKITVVDGK
ncbi:MAG: Alpha-2-macroglobulin, partial [Chthoniobacteraceae bacterium]|nr:Alpha-2-macroglobulin [Chthoniobacteraceae bacterium]